MRHLYDKPRINRSKSHRKAFFGNMSAALFLNKRITTTLGKARYARRFAERMINFARKGDVASRRHVVKFIRNKEAIKTLFDELGPHFKHREGGYTRLIKIGTRRGDAAPMCIIELVGFDDAVAEATSKKESKSKLKASQKTVVDKKKADKKEVEAVETEETTDTATDEAKSEKDAAVSDPAAVDETKADDTQGDSNEETVASEEETKDDSSDTDDQKSEDQKEDPDK